MSNMKCPFCKQELKCWDEPQNTIYSNWSCPNCRRFAYGNKLIWQELIRTRKALDIAVDALKSSDEYYMYCAKDKTLQDNAGLVAFGMDNTIAKALAEITTLEQKDKRCGGN